MSQSGLTAGQSVSWPSEGISEVPFRVYTDQDQYRREQERLFQGPTWQYLCLEVELGKLGDFVSTTVGEAAVIVVRDAAGDISAFVNRCVHRDNLLCAERQGVMYAATRGMLLDRVFTIRRANLFEPHGYRHVVGPIRLKSVEGHTAVVHSHFMVAQIMHDGVTSLFATGLALSNPRPWIPARATVNWALKEAHLSAVQC